jgi:anti-anti-sigma factor
VDDEVTPSERAVCTVALAGDYDISRTAELRDAILIDCDDHVSLIVVDTGGVTFLDSSGLRALLEVQSRLDHDGIDLRLSKAPPNDRRLLRLTGTDTVLGLDTDQ